MYYRILSWHSGSIERTAYEFLIKIISGKRKGCGYHTIQLTENILHKSSVAVFHVVHQLWIDPHSSLPRVIFAIAICDKINTKIADRKYGYAFNQSRHVSYCRIWKFLEISQIRSTQLWCRKPLRSCSGIWICETMVRRLKQRHRLINFMSLFPINAGNISNRNVIGRI